MNVALPEVVGVPVMVPVDPFSWRPAGSAPAVTANVGDGVPDAVTVNEYGVPAVAPGGVPEVIVGDVETDPAGAHPVGGVTTLESRVTAAVRARSRPWMIAPVLAVMDYVKIVVTDSRTDTAVPGPRA